MFDFISSAPGIIKVDRTETGYMCGGFDIYGGYAETRVEGSNILFIYRESLHDLSGGEYAYKNIYNSLDVDGNSDSERAWNILQMNVDGFFVRPDIKFIRPAA
jgi:hypothetical protein